MTITTRQTSAEGVVNKNSPLTNAEVDGNFIDLKQNKYEAGDSPDFANVSADSVALDTSNIVVPTAAGTMVWSQDDETVVLTLSGEVPLPLGEKCIILAKADEAIAKGDVVYASSAIGNSGKIGVSKYIANSTIPSRMVIGIAAADIALGEFGYVTAFGSVKQLDTTGTTVGETWTGGTILYASPTTAGKFTSTRPVAPNQDIAIAFVINAHANNGVLFVRAFELGQTIGDLHDVYTNGGVDDKDLLQYNNTAGRWEPVDGSTSNIAEGTNLYYTDTRVNAAIDARVNKAFVDALGVTAANVPWTGVTGKPTTFPPDAHTHAISDVTGLQTALDGKVDKVTGKGLSTEDYTTAEKSKLAGIESGAEVNTVDSVAGKTGVVTLAKSDVGLGNVDNTSDLNKPISTATQTALNAKAPLASPALTGTPTAPTATAGTNTTQVATTAFVQTAVTNLVDAAPATLDTLNELAAALGDDPNFATTVSTQIGTKLDASAYTAADVLTKIKTVDGASSGLDADLLDGQHASAFAPVSHTHVISDVTGLQDALDAAASSGGGGYDNIYEVGSNIGIGVASPEEKLDVAGNVQVTDTSGLVWAYGDGNFYNSITNNYNTPDGIRYRSGGWTGGDVVAHSFETTTGNLKRLTIHNTGYVTAHTNMRSPIFYDSDNTAYYVDPAGSTALLSNGVVVAGNEGFQSRFWASGVRNRIWSFYNSDSYGISYFQGSSGVGGADTIGIHPNGGATASGSTLQVVSGYTQSLGSMRAPIFYDSDNTGYYVDPSAATSANLAGTVAANGVRIGRNFSIANRATVRLDAANTSSPSDVLFGHTAAANQSSWDGVYWSISSRAAENGNRLTVWRGAQNPYAGSEALLFTFDPSGYLEAVGSMRAPIFYDSNNTGYYVDPASTSNLAGLTVANTITGSISGSATSLNLGGHSISSSAWAGGGGYHGYTYNGGNFRFGFSSTSGVVDVYADGNFYATDSSHLVLHAGNYNSYSPTLTGGNASGTWPINITGTAGGASTAQILNTHTGGTSNQLQYWQASGFGLNPDSSWWYAIRMSHGDADTYYSATLATSFFNDDIRFRRKVNGSDSAWRRLWHDGDATISASGDFRAPIFYDSNDTGFYVDPNGLSRTSAIAVENRVHITENRFLYMGGTATSESSWGSRDWTSGGNRYYNARSHTFNNDGYGSTFSFYVGADQANHNSSLRAPIFYDSNNTAYYVDPASTSNTNAMRASEYRGNANVGGTGEAIWCPAGIYSGSTQWLYGTTYRNGSSTYYSGGSQYGVNRIECTHNYGEGVFGVYSSTRYQHVWSMGTAYKLATDGTSVGNLYGLSWTHPNVGTGTDQAIAGLSHQLQLRENGALKCAFGAGIWTSGNVTAYSDIAVKTNLEKIPNALYKVMQINGYTYDRTDFSPDPLTGDMPEIRQAGVVAQEVEKILPEVVSGQEGNKAVAYGNMVALLIEAIKEQQTQIEALTSEINTLKEMIK